LEKAAGCVFLVSVTLGFDASDVVRYFLCPCFFIYAYNNIMYMDGFLLFSDALLQCGAVLLLLLYIKIAHGRCMVCAKTEIFRVS